MTAETDEMRLVPVEPTEAMLKAGGPALHAGMNPLKDNGAYFPERACRRIYLAMLAAAPAVQASAWLVGEGGGTILTRAAEWAAEKHDQGVEVTPLYAHRALPDPSAVQPAVGRVWDYAIRLIGTDHWGLASAYPPDFAKAVIARDGAFATWDVQPLYAHPPAQGSESGGEAFYQVGEFIGNRPVLCGHGSIDPNNLCPYCEGDLPYPGRAALSPQPGPASEGDGE